jgi:two-component system invasion response regulator UvrY
MGSTKPDVVVLSLACALRWTRPVQNAMPRISMVIVSDEAGAHVATQLVRTEVLGFVSDRASGAEILDAVWTVARGERYLTATVKNFLIRTALGECDDGLSPRELQVLQLLAEGKTVEDAAVELSINRKSINTYRQRVFDKLRLRTDCELVRYAYRRGLIY